MMPYRDREAQRKYQREWCARRRAAYLEGKRCAFCNSPDELEVHHFDPAAKVDHKIWSWSAPRRLAELAKCIPVCRPCHINRHHEQRPTHCKRGHELTNANVYVKPRTGGKRECRTCRALRRTKPAIQADRPEVVQTNKEKEPSRSG
jgi:hypothetical protein